MKESTLILTIGNYGILPFKIKNSTYIELLYKANKFNLLKRFLHKVYLLNPNIVSKLPNSLQRFLLKYMYGNWYCLLNKVNTIIFFDSIEDTEVIKLVHRLFPSKRIILWYWNSVNKNTILPQEVNRTYVELWSFDPANCQKYNMKYNVQFYPLENAQCPVKSKIKFDIVYVGANKSQERLDILERIKKNCKDEKINSYFYLVNQSKQHLRTSIKYRPLLKYPQVIQLIMKSRCILDITQKDQSGLTLRPLEALFFNKKLITNNKKIKQHKIYNLNSRNIYILGEDKRKLKEFINTPIAEENTSYLKQYYSFDSWLNNFFR